MQEEAYHIHQQTATRAREQVQQAEVSDQARPLCSGPILGTDGEAREDLVSEPPHQMEEGVHRGNLEQGKRARCNQYVQTTLGTQMLPRVGLLLTTPAELPHSYIKIIL